MAFICTDDVCTEPVRVHLGASGKSVTVTWAGTSVRLTVAEAVDLVDAVATVLAEKVSLSAPTSSATCRNLHRDENAVRIAAEVREALQ